MAVRTENWNLSLSVLELCSLSVFFIQPMTSASAQFYKDHRSFPSSLPLQRRRGSEGGEDEEVRKAYLVHCVDIVLDVITER